MFDSAGNIVYWYLRRLLCGSIKSPDDAITEIKKVSKSDITEAAKKMGIDTIYFLKGAPSGDEESEDE